MIPTIQEDKTGCGFAAVATLAGVSYRKVKRVANGLGIEVHDPRLWNDTKCVRRLLRQFGVKASMREDRFRSWEQLPAKALLAIKWQCHGDGARWHWVVFWRSPDGPQVLDSKASLRNHRRKDFGRMAPKWFIGIK